jgi:adenylate cyclase
MRRKQEEGIPIGITRIGVNTGTVTIGNVGGETFSDYRALGDAINTAARLETVNNHLGTRVCVSGSTVALCSEFVGRPVGALVLKGKTEGVEAFEPLTPAHASSPQIAAYLEAYELLRREDPGAEAAFAALVETYPDDPLAAFHLARLQRGESGIRVVFEKK